MPVGRGVAPVGRPTGDIDDPPAPWPIHEVTHSKAREVGGGPEVDLEGPRPGRLPLCIRQINASRLEDAGVVDQHVDPAVETRQGLSPEASAGARCLKVFAKDISFRRTTVADDPGAPTGQDLNNRRADAPGGARDENMGT